VIDNHFSHNSKALFPPPAFSRERSKRDVNQVLDVVLHGMSVVYDGFGDGPASLCLAVHDFELVDGVSTSPFKRLVNLWEVQGGRWYLCIDDCTLKKLQSSLSFQVLFYLSKPALSAREVTFVLKAHQPL
jgi:hypothetical protein